MSLSLFDLTGRTALVTGSSQGIGLAMAAGLARAGARVVLNGRDVAKLDAAVALLKSEGLNASGKAFDVSDSAAVESAVAEVERDVGPVSILINNAGMQHRAPADGVSDEADWHDSQDQRRQRILRRPCGGRRMIARGAGKIVNICSVQSELGRPKSRPTPPPRAR